MTSINFSFAYACTTGVCAYVSFSMTVGVLVPLTFFNNMTINPGHHNLGGPPGMLQITIFNGGIVSY